MQGKSQFSAFYFQNRDNMLDFMAGRASREPGITKMNEEGFLNTRRLSSRRRTDVDLLHPGVIPPLRGGEPRV